MTSARVMMPFRPFQLFAFIFRRGGLAAICWAVFLCFATALAQSIPEGYVASQEGDVIGIRPPVTAEHDVAIRVFPPIEDSNAEPRSFADGPHHVPSRASMRRR